MHQSRVRAQERSTTAPAAVPSVLVIGGLVAVAAQLGAQFLAARGALPWREVLPYIAAQLAGGLVAVAAVHLMFDLPIIQASTRARAGIGQWTGELVATFGLVLTIIGMLRHRPQWIAPAVALYIAAAYWFTSSTSFANPAITIIRSLSDSFAGIAPADVPAFIAAQLAGATLGALAGRWLFD